MTDTTGHLSIGEVLSLVQEEFPDVTISKIRFLESQGLIDPERTPSGYRKFYEPDIVRLRWILRQQRDHFLPLKVIKAKLETPGSLDDDEPAQGNLWADADADADTRAGRAEHDDAAPDDAAVPPTDVPSPEPAAADGEGSNDAAPSPAPATPPSRSRGRSASPATSTRDDGPDDEKDPGAAAAWLAALQEAPKRHVSAGLGKKGRAAGGEPSAPTTDEAAPATADPDVGDADDGGRLGVAEVADLTGVAVGEIADLVEYGLVAPTTVGGEKMFDAAAVEVVRACAGFAGHGVGARHLRIYKNAADREAGFYEQLILPLLKQRNPKARDRAASSLEELVDAGEALHRALVRQALRGVS
jgi:DNA-binding transcriptional MerR regulator